MPNRNHPAADDTVAQLQVELARVTRDTARLLLNPEYSESELWELDGRARELNARIRTAAGKRAHVSAQRVAAVRGGGGMVSGG